MKRLLALLLVAALVFPASATQQMWTNYGDDANIVYYGTNAKWIRTAGLNNYAYVNAVGDGAYAGVYYDFPYQMTYSAATLLGDDGQYFAYPVCRLRDVSGNVVQYQIFDRLDVAGTARYEMKMSGGTPKYYVGGVLYANGAALSQNPYYVDWGTRIISGGSFSGTTYWDDYVIAEPNAMQMSLPEGNNNTIVILKDVINPAAAGLAFGENGTQISSTTMTGRWSRGNGTIGADVAQPNESIELRYLGTDQVYATNYTGTGLYGTMAWNIKTMLIDSGAPQGLYGLYRPKTGEWGDTIMYKSNGASVAWNQDEYSVGDTGTVIYYVLAGGYWDTSLYSYKVCILDSYMNFLQNTTLTASSGNVAYEWTEDNPEGVYHAWLIATNHDGYEYVLGSDYAELVAYFGYGGYVNDCVTELPLSEANVNVTQGLTALYNGASGVNGNYTTGPLYSTGSSVFFNVTKTNYNPYQYNFVPLSSGTVNDLNLTICPTAGSGETGGLGIGGVIRDATIGRPIQGANVSLTNISNSQQYFKLTNMAGGYLCDAGTLCTLPSGRLYQVNASKVGYNTSVDYQVTV